MPRVALLVLLTVLSACSTEKAKDDPAPAPAPRTDTPGVPAPSPDGRTVVTGGTRINARLTLQLATATGGSFAAVQSILQANCTRCHSASGGQSPDMTVFPFKSARGETMAHLAGDMDTRLNNRGNVQPMPPTGPLAAADLATLNAWLQAGTPGPAATAGNAGSTQPTGSATARALNVKWSATSGTASADWERFAPSASGVYSLPLGPLVVGDRVTVTVQVLSSRGTVDSEKTYPAVSVPASGDLRLSVAAP